MAGLSPCEIRLTHLLAWASLWVASPAFAQPAKWDEIPAMQLERLYRGPLRDTVVQRWRDPADGTVCYLFIPINAQHSPPNETGYIQYGPNTIGSISCVALAGKGPLAKGKNSALDGKPAIAKQGMRAFPMSAARAAPESATRALSPSPSSRPLLDLKGSVAE